MVIYISASLFKIWPALLQRQRPGRAVSGQSPTGLGSCGEQRRLIQLAAGKQLGDPTWVAMGIGTVSPGGSRCSIRPSSNQLLVGGRTGALSASPNPTPNVLALVTFVRALSWPISRRALVSTSFHWAQQPKLPERRREGVVNQVKHACLPFDITRFKRVAIFADRELVGLSLPTASSSD